MYQSKIDEIRVFVGSVENAYIESEKGVRQLRSELKKYPKGSAIAVDIQDNIDVLENSMKRYEKSKAKYDRMKKFSDSFNERDAVSADYQMLASLAGNMGLNIKKDLQHEAEVKSKKEMAEGGVILSDFHDVVFAKGGLPLYKGELVGEDEYTASYMPSLDEVKASKVLSKRKRQVIENGKTVIKECPVVSNNMYKNFHYQNRVKGYFENKANFEILPSFVSSQLYPGVISKDGKVDEGYNRKWFKYVDSKDKTKEDVYENDLRSCSEQYNRYAGALDSISSMIVGYNDLPDDIKKRFTFENLNNWKSQLSKEISNVRRLAQIQLDVFRLEEFKLYVEDKFNPDPKKVVLGDDGKAKPIFSEKMYEKISGSLEKSKADAVKSRIAFDKKDEKFKNIPMTTLIKIESGFKDERDASAKVVDFVYKNDLNRTNDMLSLQEMNSQLIELTHLYEEAKSAGATSTASNYKHRIDELQNKIDGIKAQDKGAIKAGVEIQLQREEESKNPVINETPAQGDERKAYEARANGEPKVVKVGKYMDDPELKKPLTMYDEGAVIESERE